ncbi:MAG: class I SAM-dependent methyltransferase [Polyangiales bacterium]
MTYDATGKVSLEHIYTGADPRSYFRTLRELDYCIPQLAKPWFQQIFRAYEASHSRPVTQVIDLGCSYGINAALLRCDTTLDELYDRYAGELAAELPREALLERDLELVRERNIMPQVRFVGLDVSLPAIEYAVEAGFLDTAIQADMERHNLDQDLRRRLSRSQVVISTGCIGYVTERTLTRIVRAHGDQRPWMAHCVLRMFPFEPIEHALSSLGYETQSFGPLLKQRRFVSPLEQSQIVGRLEDLRIDPSGLEADGWLYAQLHVSRPRGTTLELTEPS